MSRRLMRRLATVFAMVLSLLFSQLALANYVCPGQGSAPAMAQAMAGGQACDDMDMAQPALCHAHAMDAAQSFELAKLAVPTLPMLVQVLELPLVQGAGEARAAFATATREAHPPPDPLYLATLRLRV